MDSIDSIEEDNIVEVDLVSLVLWFEVLFPYSFDYQNNFGKRLQNLGF